MEWRTFDVEWQWPDHVRWVARHDSAARVAARRHFAELVGETYEELVAVLHPAWLRPDVLAVGRDQWLAHCAAHGFRREVLRFAASLTERGFNHATGRQYHPKAATAIADGAGVSPRSVERNLSKPRQGAPRAPEGGTCGADETKSDSPEGVLYHPNAPGERSAPAVWRGAPGPAGQSMRPARAQVGG